MQLPPSFFLFLLEFFSFFFWQQGQNDGVSAMIVSIPEGGIRFRHGFRR